MFKIYINDYIYVLEKKLFIYDKSLTLQNKIEGNEFYIYKNIAAVLLENKIDLYNNTKLYHSIKFSKKIDKFIINDYFIFAYTGNVLSIISMIGNKIVFNAKIAKNDIKNIINKDNILFIQTEESIMALDLIQRKVVFNYAIKSKLFYIENDTIFALSKKHIYKIKMDKTTSSIDLDFEIDDFKIVDHKIVVKKANELFVLYKNTKRLITTKCKAFNIDNDEIYVLEDKLVKYSLNEEQNIIKFLTVDDSTTMRLIIKNSILNNFKNVEVYEAKNGKEALEFLETNPNIDVIFMDWNMPIMDGKTTVIKIRENSKFDKIKIIMATTEGGKDKVREMITYGVKGYLIKPLKPSSVVPLARKMIEIIKEEKNV